MAISLNNKVKATRLPGKGYPVSSPRPGSVIEQRSGMIHGFGRPIKPREVIFFCSQLSLMLEIGTSLNNALIALRDQIKNPAFREVIQAMLRDIVELCGKFGAGPVRLGGRIHAESDRKIDPMPFGSAPILCLFLRRPPQAGFRYDSPE